MKMLLKILTKLSHHRRFWDFISLLVIITLTTELLYLFLMIGSTTIKTHRIFVKVYRGRSEAIGAKVHAFVTMPGGPSKYVGSGEIDLSGSGYVEFPIEEIIEEYEHAKFNIKNVP